LNGPLHSFLSQNISSKKLNFVSQFDLGDRTWNEDLGLKEEESLDVHNYSKYLRTGFPRYLR